MSNILRVGGISAKPGETKYGVATWVELRDGTRVNLHAMLINGVRDGPRVVVHGGTHPVEMAGIGAAQTLARKIQPSKLRGSIVCFPISNPLGFQFGAYVSPHDSVNMDVAYPGSADGSPTSRLANFIWENTTQRADLVVDLHENVKPALSFTLLGRGKDRKVEQRGIELAKAFGLSIARPPDGGANFSTPGTKAGDMAYYELCMARGIPAFMPELECGTDITWDEDYQAVRVGVRGVTNCLKKLGMISGRVEPQSEVRVLKGDFEFYGTTPNRRGGIVKRLVDVGVRIKKKTPVANILDPYGRAIETIRMPVDGYVWGWNLGAPPFFNWGAQSGDGVAYVYVDSVRKMWRW